MLRAFQGPKTLAKIAKIIRYVVKSGGNVKRKNVDSLAEEGCYLYEDPSANPAPQLRLRCRIHNI